MADPLVLQLRFPQALETRFRFPPAPVANGVVIVGPPGQAGAAYNHPQPSPAAELIVNHNLGVRPSVTVLSPGGVEVGASVIHQSANQLRIYFAEPQSGSAHCV